MLQSSDAYRSSQFVHSQFGDPQRPGVWNNVSLQNTYPRYPLTTIYSGAACEAALEGIPSIAFSGTSGSEVSYTTLTNTTLASTISANIYSALAVKLTNALLANSGAILPAKTTLNVNFAATTSCTSAASYKFVLTRISPISLSSDVATCGTDRLPSESSAITQGCIATVSVMDASSKLDSSAANQAIVLSKLSSILGCL